MGFRQRRGAHRDGLNEMISISQLFQHSTMKPQLFVIMNESSKMFVGGSSFTGSLNDDNVTSEGSSNCPTLRPGWRETSCDGLRSAPQPLSRILTLRRVTSPREWEVWCQNICTSDINSVKNILRKIFWRHIKYSASRNVTRVSQS